MKTILVEFYGTHNIGDDLFIKILSERYPNVKLLLVCKNKYSKPFANMKNINIIEPPKLNVVEVLFNKLIKSVFFENRIKNKWLRFYKEQCNKIDGYLNIGGSIFIENETWSINHKIYKEKIEIFNEKKKFIIGANFGPYKTNDFLNYYSDIFKDFDNVNFRDLNSIQLFDKLDNISFAPDVVFQLCKGSFTKNNNIKNSIGFSVIDLKSRSGLKKYKNSYDDFILSMISNAIQENKKIYLFSFCKHEGDENVINEYIKKLGSKGSDINVVYYDGDIERFLKIYSSMELIVGTRFHSIVLALVYKQNLIPIAYSNKTENMLKSIGYIGPLCKMDDFDNINKNELIINSEKISYDMDILENASFQFKNMDYFIENEY